MECVMEICGGATHETVWSDRRQIEHTLRPGVYAVTRVVAGDEGDRTAGDWGGGKQTSHGAKIRIHGL